MAEIKNKITLMRFVSLRNPELSKKEGKEKRFVFQLNMGGDFFDAVNNKDSNTTKWEAMSSLATTFSTSSFKTENDVLKSVGETFYNIASWLGENRSKIIPQELLKKITEIIPMNDTTLLWDNLFYQIISSDKFYVKESLVEVLVLNNLLIQLDKLKTDAEKLSILNELINAKIVLPVELFEEDANINLNSSTKKSNEEKNIPSNEILVAQSKNISKLNIYNYKNAILEIQKVSKKYKKEKLKAFNESDKKYQEEIKPKIQEYKKRFNQLRREMCKTPRPENYDVNDFCNQPDIEYPELPEFIFDYPKETDSKYLQESLTENAFSTLQHTVNIEDIDTFQEAITVLEEASVLEEINILSKTKFSEKTLTFGGIVINTQKNPSSVNSFPFSICSGRTSLPYLVFQFNLEVPNNSFGIANIDMNLNFIDGSPTISDSYQNATTTSTIITMSNMFYDAVINLTKYNLISNITGEVTLNNGEIRTFQVPFFKIGSCAFGTLSNSDNTNNDGVNEFIPKGFGIKQIGIADYKKVVSEVCCYNAGEVSHIENIMAKELRKKETQKIHKSEVTSISETNRETENLNDTATTERFEMQTEVAKIMQESQAFSANASVGYSGFGFSANVGANYATNSNKDESNRQAVNMAKDITQKAMERIVNKYRSEKTTKITDEFTEKNEHTFDNTKGENHISGVYRFINAIYKNQIYNYGKRLMYEFMIPQPSKLHTLGLLESKSTIGNLNSALLNRPLDPRKNGLADASFLTETNYKTFASKYDAEVKPFPERYKVIGKSFSGSKAFENETFNENIDLQIPVGYQTIHTKVNIYAHWDTDNSQWHSFGVTVGNIKLFKEEYRASFELDLNTETSSVYSLDKFSEKIPVGFQSLNYLAFNVAVSIKTEISSSALEAWRVETFDSIIKGYNQQLANYNSTVSDQQSLESNPGFYRQIENTVLRKNCISYLMDEAKMGQDYYSGSTLQDYKLTQNQEMDNYASLTKFMEQAFEWDILSYNFYPFYWGKRLDWTKLYQYECNDPLFRSFMQSGMARVIVTVKPGFEDAVIYYMTTGKIWNGGRIPVLGNPLYLSIVDELKEQEYVVEETWESVVPTSLVALQRSGVAINEDGLPCGKDCSDANEKNSLQPNAKILEALPKL